MTLPDLVAFLATNRLTLRSAQIHGDGEVTGFTCDPFPEPPADVHVHLEHADDGSEPDGDALAKFLGLRGNGGDQ